DSRLPSSPSFTRTTKRPSSGAPNSATPAESGPRHPSACSMPRIVRPTSTWPSLVFAKNPTMPHIGFKDTRSILPVCWRVKQAAAAQSMVTAVYKASPQAEGEVERVYRLLHEWLVSAQLPPGEFLSDAVLAQKCKTSRTPVREACSRLAQDKWLSLIPRKGYLVKPISVRDIVELYEYRKLLECFAAARVAQSANGDYIAELNAILAPESLRPARLHDILAANEHFH